MLVHTDISIITPANHYVEVVDAHVNLFIKGFRVISGTINPGMTGFVITFLYHPFTVHCGNLSVIIHNFRPTGLLLNKGELIGTLLVRPAVTVTLQEIHCQDIQAKAREERIRQTLLDL